MLVLTRKSNQSIMIGGHEVSVLVGGRRQGAARSRLPADIPVFRRRSHLKLEEGTTDAPDAPAAETPPDVPAT